MIVIRIIKIKKNCYVSNLKEEVIKTEIEK